MVSSKNGDMRGGVILHTSLRFESLDLDSRSLVGEATRLRLSPLVALVCYQNLLRVYAFPSALSTIVYGILMRITT